MNFKHNDRITCKIDGIEITDARVSINKNGMSYICQNEKNGGITEDKLGYKYSWTLDSSCVTDLKLATPTWDTLQWKDFVVSKGGDRSMVLAIVNDLVWFSRSDNFDLNGSYCTKKELQGFGFTIEGAAPVEEITVAEAEARFGIKIKPN